MIGGNLDQDDPDAIGVLDPHLAQSPGFCGRLPDNPYSGRRQPGVLGVNVPHLDPDHYRAPRRAGCASGDLEESRAEEEHHAGIFRGTELPVDGQAEYVAVEATAPISV
jgi:hypothetical protein